MYLRIPFPNTGQNVPSYCKIKLYSKTIAPDIKKKKKKGNK